MKQIPLTKGKFALVDDEDYDRLVAIGRWHYSNGYAARNFRRKRLSDGKMVNKGIWMHRVIMDTPDGMDTDHIDNDKLNNQRINLRICSRSENQQNTCKRSHNTSGYKGVSWSKRDKKWEAKIKFDGKSRALGNFTCKHEAARAYNAAATKYFGEFACLNEI